MFLIGFRNRMAVFLNWIWAWLTYGRGARLITGDVNPLAAAAKPALCPMPGKADANVRNANEATGLPEWEA